jgi:hypothetical protein
MIKHFFFSAFFVLTLAACGGDSSSGNDLSTGQTTGTGAYGAVTFAGSAVSSGFNPCTVQHIALSGDPTKDSFVFRCQGVANAAQEVLQISFSAKTPDVVYQYISWSSNPTALHHYVYSNSNANAVSLDPIARTVTFNGTMTISGVLKF